MPFKDKQNRVCGFLDIDEQDKRKKFQRRYFVVNKSKGLLEWYMDSPSNMGDSAQPCGIINIDYITKVDEAKKMKMDYCFVINTPFRPYYVQASSQAEVEEWVEILNDASKITVPPEAMHPPSTSSDVNESLDVQNNSVDSADVSAESNDNNFTYRTEIVGNVVVKKKMSEVKKPSFDESSSPSYNSIGSDFKYPITPDSLSIQGGFFNPNEDKNVIKKGWAVKQGHVRKNWKRRYFILKRNGFSYYKSEHDKEPIRTIPIREILAAKTESGEASRLRDNLLLVATTDKIYYIQADSPDEMHDWINAFNDAIDSHKKIFKGHQVTYHQGHDLGTSEDILSEVGDVASGQPQVQHVSTRTSAYSVSLSASQDSIGNSTCSTDSQEKLHVREFAPKSENRTKPVKTHRRAESEIAVSHPYAAESTIKATRPHNQPSVTVTSFSEDVEARPGSLDLSYLSECVTDDSIQHQGSPNHTRPNGGNYVASQLDPQVDFRSAVKPSLVKKKKNPGILFSLNTMLSRKQDKIQKDKMRLNTQQS